MWYTTCSTSGNSSWTSGSSILYLTKDGLWFEIVALHDQNKLDQLYEGKYLSNFK